MDWFDDAGWEEIREHCRLLARLAHDGGLKGLLFDPEPYTEPFKQFRYGSQARRAEHSFEESCRKARQRGQEVMQAISSEFPDVVLYTYFLFSQCSRALDNTGDPQLALAGDGYGLLPAFANGWLDRLPSTATVIDGNEAAYRYDSQAAFDAAFVRIKHTCQALVSTENRAKFQAQVQVSHGIYLDAYINPPSSPWYIDGLGPRVNRLEANVSSALDAADEYVWIYGEKARWWPPREAVAKAAPTWPEALPGVEFALLSAKDPAEAARRMLNQMRAQGSLTNLLLNGDFTRDRNGQPEAWSQWQDEKHSHGVFRHDPDVGAASPGAACVSGVEQGCFLQSIKAESGQRYILCGKIRQRGAGKAWLTVRWQTPEGRWTAEERDRHFFAPDRLGVWNEVVGAATVPKGAGRLVILAGVSDQHNADDRVWFDDVVVAPFE